MAKRWIKHFDFLEPHVKVWCESYRLLGGKCPLCGQPVKISRKMVENVLEKDFLLETLRFWMRRYEKLRKVREDFDQNRIGSVVDFVDRLKKALNEPVKSIYGYPEAGTRTMVYVCDECGEKYPLTIHYRVVGRIYISVEDMFSWYQVFEKFEDLGDKRLNYQLKKYFGLMYRDLREEIFKRCKEGDYGLLIDVSLFLKRRLHLAPNLYLPRARMTAEKEEERREFWDGFSLDSTTFVPAKK